MHAQPSIAFTDSTPQMWTQFSSNSTFELGFENPNEDMDCEALTLSYEGVDYTMVQLHFHSPSEHTFGGGHYSAEVHMVHKSADGLYLVLGALLQESADTIQHSNNTFLNTLWDAGGSQLLGGVPIFINASSALDPYSSFLPQSRVQYAYSGSLTTPPCTENVQWILFQFPVIISISDIYLLRKLMNMNSASDAILYDGNSNRPLQPLNGRTVYWSYGEVPDSSIYTPYADGNDDDKIAHTALGLGATAFVFAIVGIVLGGLALTLLKKSDGAAPPTPAAAPAAPVAAVELKGQPAAAPIKSPMAEETPV